MCVAHTAAFLNVSAYHRPARNKHIRAFAPTIRYFFGSNGLNVDDVVESGLMEEGFFGSDAGAAGIEDWLTDAEIFGKLTCAAGTE